MITKSRCVGRTHASLILRRKNPATFEQTDSQVLASRCKVDASGWPNETLFERKSKTCVGLRVRLARALEKTNKQTAVVTNILRIQSFPYNYRMEHFQSLVQDSHKLDFVQFASTKQISRACRKRVIYPVPEPNVK